MTSTTEGTSFATPATSAFRTGFLEVPARGIVSATRRGRRHRLGLSAIGLFVVLILGIGYLVFGVFHSSPAASPIVVRVQLKESGGLLAGQNVTLRGVPVGRVRQVDLTRDGVVAQAEIDSSVQIPVQGEVRVAGLSLAGEQYLDFRPTTSSGPFLADGTVISADQTTTPVPLANVLDDLSGTLEQIDPEKLRTITHELGVSSQGSERLADIIDGGTFLISTLDSVLPQTVSLLKTSRTVLTTLGQGAPALTETSKDLSHLMAGAARKQNGYRTLLARTPAALKATDAIIADNAPTMVQLLGNLATVTQMAYVRIPALNEFFFPKDRDGSTLGALSTTMRDGGIWAAVNIYPRNTCDYGLPRLPPSQPDHPEPYLYTYCNNPDPSVLIRGARNAPRPPGDDTAGPPPGAAPDARSSPSPTGPQSIPLPFAGPALPSTP
ncbi:MlaD family protein [Gordonia hankookensis]|uniref:MCE family protein n=1 Tax=Gordonia hankookensis TaxID=589403 RepID=A0ABR7WA82_9ACTN|nr:MCE family protein [Gordonia hankookensis]MBD1319515.1 MCE family protein [Gordonia hankookensis]